MYKQAVNSESAKPSGIFMVFFIASDCALIERESERERKSEREWERERESKNRQMIQIKYELRAEGQISKRSLVRMAFPWT